MKNSVRIGVPVLFAFASVACQGASGPLDAPTPLSSSSSSGASAASTSLLDANWKLVELNGQKALAGVSVTAAFASGDRVSGSGGCNRYFGAATAKDGKVKVSPVGSTRMYCAEAGVADQEDAYFSALAKVTDYVVVGDELRLRAQDGEATLVFVRD